MQKTWQKILLGCMLMGLVALCAAGCGEDKAGGADASGLTCTVDIRCDELLNSEAMTNEDILPYIPDDGVILAVTELNYAEDDTVFDVLQAATMAQKIPLDFENSASGAFVKGINNIYGGEIGDMSGWLYQVNDVAPNVNCSSYKLEDGDKVVWYYSSGMAE